MINSTSNNSSYSKPDSADQDSHQGSHNSLFDGLEEEFSSATTTNQSPSAEYTVPVCFSCNDQITGTSLLAGGNQYHPEHFRCQGKPNAKISLQRGRGRDMQVCGRPLATAVFFEKSGKVLCEGCFSESNSAICKFCSEPILDVILKSLLTY